MAIARYGDHTICVSEADSDLLSDHRWRVIAVSGSYQVAASAPAEYPGDRRRRNLVLARMVGARMGFPLQAMVGFRNRDSLDCRRENLFQFGTMALTRSRPRRKPVSNPAGLHRHKLGDARPPARYALCCGPQGSNGRCRELDLTAVATRVPQTASTALWTVQTGTGQICGPVPWHQLGDLLTGREAAQRT